MRFSDLLMAAAMQAGGWTPYALGPSLLAWWDARRTDLITESGGAVSSWRDIVAGYDMVQATGSARPTLSNGYIIPDGVDDELTLAPVPGGIPTGAAGCIIWWGGDQNVAAGNTTTMALFGYGNVSSTWRYLTRSVSSGVNRAGIRVGNGTTTVGAVPTADFSGKKVVSAVIDGTNITCETGGVITAPAACVPSTGTVRLRAFASPNTLAGNTFSSIPTKQIIITSSTLTAAQKALVNAYIQGSL